MNILKLYENLSKEDRVFKKHGKDLYKRIIDSYKSKGYTLYYYDDDTFKLIEIPAVRNDGQTGKFKWKGIWGELIFFLDDDEYDETMKFINITKKTHDKHIESARLLKKLPMSHIYYDILKINK